MPCIVIARITLQQFSSLVDARRVRADSSSKICTSSVVTTTTQIKQVDRNAGKGVDNANAMLSHWIRQVKSMGYDSTKERA